jgi:hypothetical protein
MAIRMMKDEIRGGRHRLMAIRDMHKIINGPLQDSYGQSHHGPQDNQRHSTLPHRPERPNQAQGSSRGTASLAVAGAGITTSSSSGDSIRAEHY